MSDNKNLYALLESKFIAAGDKPALVIPGAASISYRELIDNVSRMTRALHTLGVRPQDRVMVQVDKSAANLYLYLATLKIGAIYNPLNTAYTAHELDYFIGDARPALAVIPEDRRAAITPIAAKYGVGQVTTLEADGSGRLTDLAFVELKDKDAAAQTHHCGDDDLAALIYTSGTTGRSKGAMISHKNLASNGQVLHDYWGFQKDDVLLHALPIFHVHGLFVALHTAFLAGATLHWLPKFDLGEVIALLPKSTVMMGVPTFYTRLLASRDFDKRLCRNMRLFISGSAPLLSETHSQFEQRSGHEILERYGMSETGMITSNPYRTEDGTRIAGTVGFVLPGSNLRIADAQGTVLGAQEIGILETKGPNIFAGYWKRPDKTEEEFRDDGFFITGDLAQIDETGRVTIVGRAKDLIISGGFNIYPKEVETLLNDFANIAESAVVGVPHPDFGEGVIAIIVPHADMPPPDERTIITELATRLAKFKLPKRVFVAEKLPRNAMGKVQKNDLRTKFAGTFTI